MGKVFAFHGGIHPPENKKQSTVLPIQPGPQPKRVRLSLQQHIGAPAEPMVQVGDRVLKGQQIAAPVGRISAAVHASVSGTVTAIGAMPVAHSSGLDALCIEIESDGREQWVERQGLTDYRSLKRVDLIDYIRNMGIAGMGGAGFPTDVKLHLSEDHIVNTLIINAAECEPYITADDMLMRERAEEVIGGIEVIAHLLKPSHILIGVEDNKPQAIRALQQARRGNPLNIDVAVVPTKYPSGGEKQLIKLLTDVEVPSGHIPADVGIVCQNVGTTVAIHRAVRHGEPLISRIVTLTGEALAQPQNLEVAIGTPFADLLDAASLKEGLLSRLVVGGPMMGFTVDDDELPITKTTNCLIAATGDEMPAANPAQPCIRCGQCEQVCPAELLPQQLHWFAKGREFDKARQHNLFDCIECGACSYVCPSEIPLVQYYRFAKSEIRQEEAEQRKAEHAKQRFEARQARLEAEKAEKEARRKQRAEEAARAQAVRKDKSAAATAAAPAETDTKALKTAAAVARTKLKKAQKAYETGKESGAENLAELEAALKAAEQKANEAQQALEQAEQGTAASAGSGAAAPDLKQLKTNAAVARTKLKQAEKALKNAEDKGLDGIDKLRETVNALQAKADAAQQAYDQAQAAPAPTAAPVDIKQLKTNAAVARTKLKQAEKALAKAQQSGEGDLEDLQAKLSELQAKADSAQQAYEQAESGAGQAGQAVAQPAVSQAQLDELKADMEAMQGKVAKAQQALDDALAKGSPAADKMKAGVDKLQAKLDDASKAYQDAQAQASQVVAQPAVSQAQLDELKADMEAMQGKVAKAQQALDDALAKGSPAADKMKAGVDKLQAKLADASKAYQDAQAQVSQAVAQPAVSQAQLDELKADMEAMQGKVAKAQQALDDAVANGSPAADKMKAGVDKLQAKLADARAAYQAAGGTLLEEPSEPEQPQAPELDLKALKQQVSIMRTKLGKAQKALDEAEPQGTDLSALQAEVDQLQQRHDEAKQQFEAVEAGQIQAAAAQGVDLKQLKIDAAMARAAVTKAERALEKALQTADGESADEQLQQELQQAKQKADALNATLSRFE
ncbi:electron transport complex subunit RsxC [Marinobacterium arenosum]|uniref:electron transport complex subunit RsxC n=1 Tax=Marinobacterium arenosum TaxID=2862496 RepID=UPI001C971331|nr:electron transport complex subunit RsxC [Marinobacterium arenosum]MBY4675468.1 electron transport complex subunit RsxC [Marinobacterium arenosum]